MTSQRQLVLDFIKAYMRLHGISPSYEVIAKGLGLKSKSNIHRIIHRLQSDGYLTVTPYKFRSVKVKDKSVKAVEDL
jgi:repressor LexA